MQILFVTKTRLDTFLYVAASRRRRRGFSNVIRRFAWILREGAALHKVGSEIEAIKVKINKHTAMLRTYGVRDLTSAEGSSSAHEKQLMLRRTYPHNVEEDFVGFQDDVRNLVKDLKEKEFRAMSIWGMGGSGKTTLAKKVYHDKEVRRHFEAFAWACISQQFNKEAVLKEILNQLMPEKRDVHMTDGERVKHLFDIQEKKKCLVVLDDIWYEDQWDIISCAFPNGNTGSRILLTSRNKDVAAHIDPFGIFHDQRLLNVEESYELFRKKAFPRSGDGTDFHMDAEMEKLGMEIVKKCGGLPLAIVVLGGLLATKQTLNQWQKVHQNVGSYLKGDNGYGAGGQDGRILDVLALSYQDLPYQLKDCFLYLGNYPEDFDIEVEKLYRLWMAEGILFASQEDEESVREESMMDMGDRYLSELAHRCMVRVELEPEEEYYSPILGRRRFKYCRLHDLMQELCLKR